MNSRNLETNFQCASGRLQKSTIKVAHEIEEQSRGTLIDCEQQKVSLEGKKAESRHLTSPEPH